MSDGDAAAIYRMALWLMERQGWRRTEPGEGWWYRDGGQEETFGVALEETLHELAVDTRQEPPVEAERPDVQTPFDAEWLEAEGD